MAAMIKLYLNKCPVKLLGAIFLINPFNIILYDKPVLFEFLFYFRNFFKKEISY